jgi:hypothetical protein
VNASLVCLVVALSAPPQAAESFSVYKPVADFQAVVRGQTPGYNNFPGGGPPIQSNPAPTYVVPPGSYPAPTPEIYGAPVPGGYGAPAPGGYGAPPPGGYVLPPSGGYSPYQPAPLTGDPFLGSPGYGYSPYSNHFAFGANGPQPYRFGWTVRQEAGFIPKVSTEGNLGNFGVTEFDTELEYTTALPPGWIFSFTQQYNLRLWEGPHSKTPAAIGLPGNVHRFGWDFELSTPANAPFSVQLAFNPSINSDFQRHLTSDAWNWDGRGIAFFRASPHWMIALGAGFWDRVNDRVIPYAGAIWTPDPYWEWRLVFPEPRVSYLLSNAYGMKTWIYVAGEYHVEAYEIVVDRVAPGGRQDKIELEDWRVLLGIRNDCCRFTSFVETGWVFGRHVDFLRTPGFDVTTGFIVRGGVQF